jgi:hypothetical protein
MLPKQQRVRVEWCGGGPSTATSRAEWLCCPKQQVLSGYVVRNSSRFVLSGGKEGGGALMDGVQTAALCALVSLSSLAE